METELRISSTPWRLPQTEDARVMRKRQLQLDYLEFQWFDPIEYSSQERSRIRHQVQQVSNRGLTCRRPVEWPPREMKALHLFDGCTRKLRALVLLLVPRFGREK